MLQKQLERHPCGAAERHRTITSAHKRSPSTVKSVGWLGSKPVPFSAVARSTLDRSAATYTGRRPCRCGGGVNEQYEGCLGQASLKGCMQWLWLVGGRVRREVGRFLRKPLPAIPQAV